jgi:hypothetical protein
VVGGAATAEFCYVATLVGERGEPALEEREAEGGLSCESVNAHKGVEMMKGIEPTSELGASVRERNVWLLEQALERDWYLNGISMNGPGR